MDDLSPANIGHNQAPDPLDLIRNDLKTENAALFERADNLIEAFDRIPPKVDDEVTASKVTDQVRLMKGCAKALDEQRVVAKRPYDEKASAVHGLFKGPIDDLSGKAKTLEGRLNIYTQQKLADERKRLEEEARKAREEAEAAARAARTEGDLEEAVKAEEVAKAAQDATQTRTADLGRVRGDYGGTASVRTTWAFKIDDARKIDLEAIRPYLDLTAIEKAVRAFVKAGGRELKGATIFQDQQTVVR